MPTYQYRCRDCEFVFETAQRITEAPLTKCGECGGRVRRVIQPVGVIFKGPGFHVNDYPNSKGRKRSDIPPPSRDETPSAGSAPGKSTDSSTDHKADGKPANKPSPEGSST